MSFDIVVKILFCFQRERGTLFNEISDEALLCSGGLSFLLRV